MLPQTPEQWGAVLFWCGGIGLALMGLMVGASIARERIADNEARRFDADRALREWTK